MKAHLSDAVPATVAALDRKTDGSIPNIGGGREITLLDAVSLIANRLEVTPVIKHGDSKKGNQRRAVANTNRAREHLVRQPQVEPAEGLRRQAPWVREHMTLPAC